MGDLFCIQETPGLSGRVGIYAKRSERLFQNPNVVAMVTTDRDVSLVF